MTTFNPFKKTSIKVRVLFALLLVILGTSCGLGVASYFLLKNSTEKIEQQKFELLASQASDNFHTFVQGKLAMLERIAQGREFLDFSTTFREPAINAYFLKFRKEFSVLAYVDVTGQERIVIQDGEVTYKHLDLYSSAIFRTARSTLQKPFVLSVTATPHLDEPGLAFILHKRNYFGDEFKGILVGIIPYSKIFSELINFNLTDSMFFVAIDPHDTLIEQTAKTTTLFKPDDSAGFGHLFLSVPSTVSEGTRHIKYKGDDCFIAFHKPDNSDWLFLLGEPYKAFMRAPYQLQKLFLSITAAFLCLGALLALYLARNFTAPIIDLSKAIQKVSQGKLEQVAGEKSNDEIGQLISSFNEMTKNLKETTTSRDYFNSILASLNEALIITSKDLTIQRCNDATETLFGYTPTELDQQSLRILFPPESTIFSQMAGDSKTFTVKRLEAACLTKNGKTRETLIGLSSMVAAPGYDNGQATMYIWTFIDITDRKIAERELQNNQLYLQTLMATVMVGIVVITPETHEIVDCNDTALKILGRRREELIGSECYNYICPQQQEECPITDLGQEIDKAEGVVVNSKGKSVPVLKSIKTLAIDHSELLVETFVDISEQKKLEKEIKKSEAKMRQLAITDDLTGLLNRRGFKTMAQQQINSAKRKKDATFLFYADLDNLKWINDTSGHDAGDQIIKEAAFVLQQTFRKADIIGRMGGDEFAVLITDKPQSYDMKTVCERLQRHIDILNKEEGRQHELSMSIGTVICDDFATLSFEELLSKADNVMYENKMRKKKGTSPG